MFAHYQSHHNHHHHQHDDASFYTTTSGSCAPVDHSMMDHHHHEYAAGGGGAEHAYGNDYQRAAGYAYSAQHHQPPHDSSSAYDERHVVAEGPSACAVCLTQQVPFSGAACSRRCDWVKHGCCPQCGRGRPYGSPTVFCVSGCANQARQANWCVGCGVRQIPHGQQSCLMPACAATVERLLARHNHSHSHHIGALTRPIINTSTSSHRGAAQPSHVAVLGGRRGSDSSSASTSGAAAGPSAPPLTLKTLGGTARSRRAEPHAMLPAADKIFSAVRQQVGADVAKRLSAVVKVGSSVEHRKQYTAYRCRVEQDLNDVCGIGAPKFGHGGEGNEHRRFLRLAMRCSGPDGHADAVRTSCRDDGGCQLCAFLDGGLAAAFVGRETVPAFSTAAKAADGAEPCAILVCRVTVGNPAVCLASCESASGAEAAAAKIAPVPLQDRIHSRVVRYTAFDVAHIPITVPAIDAQFVAVIGASSSSTAAVAADEAGAIAAVAATSHQSGCAANAKKQRPFTTGGRR